MLLAQVIDTISSGPGGLIMEEKMSLLDLVFKGGPVMVPIALLSLVAVYIFVERYLTIRKATRIENYFMNNIRDYMHNGNIEAVKSLCKNTDSPMARMIEKGAASIGKPIKDISTAIENAGKLEVYKLERGLAVMATIAGAAPMLGFLGTVTGMINAFYNMSKAGNNIEPGMLAGGIYEAMITTAAGLIVGIVAYMAYNLLVSMVQSVIHKLESTSMEFLELIQVTK